MIYPDEVWGCFSDVARDQILREAEILMSWQDCKKKWSNSPEGLRLKGLTDIDLWDIPELKHICEKFRRGYYTDEEFRAILINEIKDLEFHE